MHGNRLVERRFSEQMLNADKNEQGRCWKRAETTWNVCLLTFVAPLAVLRVWVCLEPELEDL